jgi:hypothetical protein
MPGVKEDNDRTDLDIVDIWPLVRERRGQGALMVGRGSRRAADRLSQADHEWMPMAANQSAFIRVYSRSLAVSFHHRGSRPRLSGSFALPVLGVFGTAQTAVTVFVLEFLP